jgi:hypothetical protein
MISINPILWKSMELLYPRKFDKISDQSRNSIKGMRFWYSCHNGHIQDMGRERKG